jgi:hypothetical protein
LRAARPREFIEQGIGLGDHVGRHVDVVAVAAHECFEARQETLHHRVRLERQSGIIQGHRAGLSGVRVVKVDEVLAVWRRGEEIAQGAQGVEIVQHGRRRWHDEVGRPVAKAGRQVRIVETGLQRVVVEIRIRGEADGMDHHCAVTRVGDVHPAAADAQPEMIQRRATARLDGRGAPARTGALGRDQQSATRCRVGKASFVRVIVSPNR